MTTNERIMKAAAALKANNISGRVKGVQVDEYNANIVYIRIQENVAWDISQYTINIRTGKVA